MGEMMDKKQICAQNIKISADKIAESDNMAEILGEIYKIEKELNDMKYYFRSELNNDYLEGYHLTVRTWNTLQRAKVLTFQDLRYVTKDQLEKFRNLGEKGLNEIYSICNKCGLEIGSDADRVPHFSEGDKVVIVADNADKVPIGQTAIITKVCQSYYSFYPIYYQCEVNSNAKYYFSAGQIKSLENNLNYEYKE